MSYFEHTGYGHTWKRYSGDLGKCQCGTFLPSHIRFTLSLPRDQKGQEDCARAFDLLAEHGLIPAMPSMHQERLELGDNASTLL